MRKPVGAPSWEPSSCLVSMKNISFSCGLGFDPRPWEIAGQMYDPKGVFVSFLVGVWTEGVHALGGATPESFPPARAARAAATDTQTGRLQEQAATPSPSGGWTSQTPVSAGSVSSGPLSLACRWRSSLRLQVVFPLYLPVSKSSFLGGHQSDWMRAPPQ